MFREYDKTVLKHCDSIPKSLMFQNYSSIHTNANVSKAIQIQGLRASVSQTAAAEKRDAALVKKLSSIDTLEISKKQAVVDNLETRLAKLEGNPTANQAEIEQVQNELSLAITNRNRAEVRVLLSKMKKAELQELAKDYRASLVQEPEKIIPMDRQRAAEIIAGYSQRWLKSKSTTKESLVDYIIQSEMVLLDNQNLGRLKDSLTDRRIVEPVDLPPLEESVQEPVVDLREIDETPEDVPTEVVPVGQEDPETFVSRLFGEPREQTFVEQMFRPPSPSPQSGELFSLFRA